MVHRAPDSRLLANLINHEKEYAKHLTALFPLSHAALAALSAYAAASPSSHPTSPANTITTIVDVLASADDALQRYTHAIETWREQLVALKVLEDDLVAILRDRDILVTRLIKASKSTRETHRSSRLIAPMPALGSASLSSLPSTNSTGVSVSPASTNAKLAQAQVELQACEAHLASKERELDARRITLAREGLGARCRALIDCGWVWGEMGKQGLRVLQTLNADGSGTGLSTPNQSLAPPRPSTNIMYASDSSSLSPSQSASQTAASHESSASRQPESSSKPPARAPRASDDLTITLPPAHAISELELPTSIPAQPPPFENAGSTPVVLPPPTRNRSKRSRRPISQNITEASDEASDGPASPSNRTANANASATPVSHTPFPTTTVSPHDTSSDEERPSGALQVVENDPFEVIRRSMIGPTAFSPRPLGATSPTAHASAPDVRASAHYDSSPTKAVFSASVSGHGQRGGMGMGTGSPGGTTSSSPKRQRRSSLLFFGSLRGLFRRPKERGKVSTEWGASGSPSPSSTNLNLTRAKTSGWVTRTDARIKGRGEDSDDEVPSKRYATTTGATTTATATNGGNVLRGPSGARLRKGRPSASANVREHGTSQRADGWSTDAPGGAGAGSEPNAALGRSRTRRGTVRRKKTSVADLRGGEQGHTDGEVDGARRSLQRASSKRMGQVQALPIAKPLVEDIQEDEAPAVRSPGTQHRRATADVTVASSHGPSSSDDATLGHRRSASMTFVDAQPTTVVISASTSTSTQATHTSTSTSMNMSWRKPPPSIESLSASPPTPPSQSQSQNLTRSQSLQIQPTARAHEAQGKPGARRLGNGSKHVQNQSLMSIVADVTRQNQGQSQHEDRAFLDRSMSLDMPRAPGSVFRDRDVERRGSGMSGSAGGSGHGRTTSEDVNGRQGGQREVKMPLRSALRNASRTPSPVPPTPVRAAVVQQPVKQDKDATREQERGGRSVSPPWRDSASISSYETGRESLCGEVEPMATRRGSRVGGRSRSQPPSTRSSMVVDGDKDKDKDKDKDALMRSPSRSRSRSPPPFRFPPPPVDPPPVRASNANADAHANRDANANSNSNSASASTGNANATEPGSSNASTETPAVRRKSVRVSLQPTFSPSPPALFDDDDDDVEDQGPPWSGRRAQSLDKTNGDRTHKTHKKGSGDVWADSSEEDEVYSRAKRLLSLVGRGR